MNGVKGGSEDTSLAPYSAWQRSSRFYCGAVSQAEQQLRQGRPLHPLSRENPFALPEQWRLALLCQEGPPFAQFRIDWYVSFTERALVGSIGFKVDRDQGMDRHSANGRGLYISTIA